MSKRSKTGRGNKTVRAGIVTNPYRSRPSGQHYIAKGKRTSLYLVEGPGLEKDCAPLQYSRAQDVVKRLNTVYALGVRAAIDEVLAALRKSLDVEVVRRTERKDGGGSLKVKLKARKARK